MVPHLHNIRQYDEGDNFPLAENIVLKNFHMDDNNQELVDKIRSIENITKDKEFKPEQKEI